MAVVVVAAAAGPLIAQQKPFVMDQIAERLRYIQNTNPVLQTRIKERKFQQWNKSSSQSSSYPDSSSLSKSSGEASVPAPGWGQMRHNQPVPKPATTEVVDSGMKFPWEKGADEWNSREEFSAEKKARVKPPTMAELTIPEDELKRLRNLGLLVRRRLKIGRLGVTPGIVDAIHEGWRTEEIIKVKCDGPPALNMKKTHEDLESRTGGLVIWRSGGAAVVYRGKNYVPPSVRYAEEKAEEERKRLMSLDLEEEDSVDVVTTTEKVVADNISGVQAVFRFISFFSPALGFLA
jgi:RNA-binding protein YhbY